MGMSNYTDFASGVTIRGVPLQMTNPGKVFWVNSTTVIPVGGIGGSNGNKGTYLAPFATIDYAVGACTASRGDIIMVMPGHVETVTAAAGLDLDVAGITLIGLGQGSLRPKINFTTAVGADMDVDAANITMINFQFTGGVDALTGPIDVNAAYFTMLNCETADVTGQAVDFIVTDANADDLLIDGWKHKGAAAAGADTAITIVGGDNITIKNFDIDGNFAVAAIENVTTAAVNLSVYGDSVSYARTRNAADVIFTAVSTTTGNVGPNIYARLQDNAANITEAFVGAAMHFYQDIAIVNADGESSMLTNITASTDA